MSVQDGFALLEQSLDSLLLVNNLNVADVMSLARQSTNELGDALAMNMFVSGSFNNVLAAEAAESGKARLVGRSECMRFWVQYGCVAVVAVRLGGRWL